MRAPEFWYARNGRDAAPVTRALLTPLSWIYGAIAKARFERVQPTRVDVPVICLGNASVGGTGKTPAAMTMARMLQAQGRKPAFLTRGYKRKNPSPTQVDPDRHGANDVGDEPLLLAQLAPTFVGANRVETARMAMESGADCIIMDDGLQNPSLHKDLSILVVDGRRGFGNGRLLPAGPLREPVQAALSGVQAVLVMGEKTPKALLDLDMPLWRGGLQPQSTLPPGPWIAFAGIGDPQRFFDALQSAGADVRQEFPFADHHAYDQKDCARLLRWAQAEGAKLITTEKDFVRLPVSMQAQTSQWPVRMVLDAASEAELAAMLEGLF